MGFRLFSVGVFLPVRRVVPVCLPAFCSCVSCRYRVGAGPVSGGSWRRGYSSPTAFSSPMPREPLISTSALSTGCARSAAMRCSRSAKSVIRAGCGFQAGWGPGEFRADEHHFCLRSLRCEADDSGVFLLGPGASSSISPGSAGGGYARRAARRGNSRPMPAYSRGWRCNSPR